MRKVIFALLFILLFSFIPSQAQFTKAEIKVHGLTCSLCSRSVEMNLKKLSFIDKIETNLETTTTIITFKEDVPVLPEELSAAVDKAGFSVGYIRMIYDFKTPSSDCFEGEDETFTFVGKEKNISAGVQEIVMIEKDMLENKLFKEYKSSLPEPCKTSKRHYYVALADQLLLN